MNLPNKSAKKKLNRLWKYCPTKQVAEKVKELLTDDKMEAAIYVKGKEVSGN